MIGWLSKMSKMWKLEWGRVEVMQSELISLSWRWRKRFMIPFCAINVRRNNETSLIKNLLAAGIADTTGFGFSQQEFFLIIQTKFMKDMMLKYLLFYWFSISALLSIFVRNCASFHFVCFSFNVMEYLLSAPRLPLIAMLPYLAFHRLGLG